MARALVFDLVTRDKSFSRGLGQAERKAGGFQRTMGRVAGAAAGALAGGAIIAGVKSFTDAFKESREVAEQTATVIASTKGAAGLSAQGFSDLATAISKTVAVDDELIQSGENILATFTNVKGDIFKGATTAAVDMAAAMNGGEVSAEGLKSSNILLGKALQDPVKGLGALTRVGVTFTQKQKDQIAAMVKAGDTAGAQKIILGELKKEFGGSAEAAATSGKKLSVAWGNAQETLGGLLLPAIERGQELLIGLIGWVDKNRGAATALAAAVGVVAGTLLAAAAATKVKAAWDVAWAVATKAVTAGQWLLNAALSANPIGLVVVAVALLVGGLVLAYRKSETFRDIVTGVWKAVKTAVLTAVSVIVGVMRGWLNTAFTVVEGILTVFGKLPGPMGAPFRTAAQAVKDAKVTIIGQIDKIQDAIDALKGTDVDISATTSLHFTKTFTQKDWLNARLAAGRMATGGRIPGMAAATGCRSWPRPARPSSTRSAPAASPGCWPRWGCPGSPSAARSARPAPRMPVSES
jgi:hypothetical protein